MGLMRVGWRRGERFLQIDFGCWILDFGLAEADAMTRGFCPAFAGHAFAWIFNWPYFVPHVRDFEGRPQRAGLVSRLGGIRLGLALPSER